MKKIQRSSQRSSKLKESESSARPAAKASRSADSGENLNIAQIKELIDLISEKQFNEFELERGGFRLRLQKGASRMVVETTGSHAASPSAFVESRMSEPQAIAPATVPAPAPVEEKLHIITSPIVGTFFRSPSPTSDAFVKLGDSVESGQTLCIVEAMKLMNEIQSDASGIIAKIFVENGQPIEYGQPLFGLKS